MGPTAKLLTDVGQVDAVAHNLAALAEIAGMDLALLPITSDSAVADAWIAEQLKAPALIASADTLATLLKGANLESITKHARFVLIYGLDRVTPESARRLFGGGEASGVVPSPAQSERDRYHLPRDGATVSLQLAGMSFESNARPGRAISISGNSAAGLAGESITRIIDRNDLPFLVSLRRGECEIFLLASSDVCDLDTPAPSGELPADAYAALIPWLVFMRRAAGARCWHNPAPKACLTIDDPPLHPRYGFLSYAALVDSMRRAEFTTTIAFIPWNYSRSMRSATELFHKHGSMLSLCVHGCDHTGGEFGSIDPDLLRQKSRTALERMRLHEAATGVGWDPVMIFPQGVFSSASLSALRAEGYLAAVNSGIASVDRPGANHVADFLTPASLAYGGVPLFKRHYPRDLLPFAFDLFIGRPVLITEHHTYFRSGYDAVSAFASRLKAIEPRLSWAPLGHTLRTAVQQRVTSTGVELRAYTDEIIIDAPEARGPRTLIKPETDADSICDVRVNGQPAAYRIKSDCIELPIDADGECRVDVIRRQPAPSRLALPSLGYRAKVAARRYLSELRDNAPTTFGRRLRPARRIGSPAR